MTAVVQHARFAPSSAHIYGPGGCAGSVAMIEAQPAQEPTDDTREGDAAHWLLHQTLERWLVPPNAVAPNGVPIDDEMRESIVEIVADVRDTISAGGGQQFYEQKVGAPVTIHADFWGTPDAIVIQRDAKRLHIWDFKYGHRFVDAFRNWQMIGYAACVAETHHIDDLADWSVTLTIAQPRCYERDELGGTLREWFVSGGELVGLIGQLREAVWKAAEPGAPCKTGDYCRDCTAQWDCPANRRMGGALLDIAMAQGSAGLTPAQVGVEARTLALAADRIKARLAALDAQTQDLLNRGQDVPFHKIGWTNPRTVWEKTKQAEAAKLVAMFGVDVQMGVALPTPTQCVKQGVDETVIKPYVSSGTPTQKLVRVDTDSAGKVLGSR